MIVILLAVSFNCETTLPKKSFLQVKLHNTSSSDSSNTTSTESTEKSTDTTNSTETAADICGQAKEYQSLMLDVQNSIQELAEAFEDHYNDLKAFENSSSEVVDKYHWQERAQDFIDYYVNKTFELAHVYEDLNNTVLEIKTTYCDMKLPVVAPVINTTNTTADNTTITNQSTHVNATNTTADNTPVTNHTTSISTGSINATVPASNEAVGVTQATDAPKTAGTTDVDTMTIFVQRLQHVASEFGLPANYVQLKFEKLRKKFKNGEEVT